MSGLVIARGVPPVSDLARHGATADKWSPDVTNAPGKDSEITASFNALSTRAATPTPDEARRDIITKVGEEAHSSGALRRNTEAGTAPLSSVVVGATKAAASNAGNEPQEDAEKFKAKLAPDKVERNVGPSWWAVLAQASYRIAGTPYTMQQDKTLGVDVGTNELPKVLKAAPEIRLGDNTGPVSVGFPLKDDEKTYVAEARIVTPDGKTILDRAKPTGARGEFVFGGSDALYPSGSFLVYKLSDNTSFHMPLREPPTA